MQLDTVRHQNDPKLARSLKYVYFISLVYSRCKLAMCFIALCVAVNITAIIANVTILVNHDHFVHSYVQNT